MRILYQHRTRAQDGSATHIEGLIAALRALGSDVIVLAPSRRGQSAENGRALRRALPRWLHELLELAYNIPEAGRLWRAVRRYAPDAIYERSNVFALAATAMAARRAVPRIIEVNAPYAMERGQHGGLAFERLAGWTERVAWRGADAVIAVTRDLARIVECSGVPRERIHVMGNGVESAQLGAPLAEAPPLWPGLTVLGFTGFVRDWNCLDRAVDLLAGRGNESLALLVVGDGPARRALELQAERLRVSERVRFTGRVDAREVPRWSARFDIALQPAANPYASPLKLVEYMVLGRAIVAPDQPNIREVLTHEHDALLFVPGNQAAFAAAVRRLAEDPALRARLGARAADTVRRRELTWTRNARAVLELIREASRRRAPADSPALTRSSLR